MMKQKPIQLIALTVGLVLSAPTTLVASPLAGAAPLIAQQAYQSVIAALRKEGYRVTEVRRTLLGRIRIIVRNGKYVREVIVSPNTGEVKSDRVVTFLTTDASGNVVETQPGRAGQSQGNSGGNANRPDDAGRPDSTGSSNKPDNAGRPDDAGKGSSNGGGKGRN